MRDLVDDLTSSITVTALQEMLFQRNRAPPHASKLATAFLDRNIPSRLIGRRGPIYSTARPQRLSG